MRVKKIRDTYHEFETEPESDKKGKEVLLERSNPNYSEY